MMRESIRMIRAADLRAESTARPTAGGAKIYCNRQFVSWPNSGPEYEGEQQFEGFIQLGEPFVVPIEQQSSCAITVHARPVMGPDYYEFVYDDYLDFYGLNIIISINFEKS